jgi:hypothetical protein
LTQKISPKQSPLVDDVQGAVLPLSTTRKNKASAKVSVENKTEAFAQTK